MSDTWLRFFARLPNGLQFVVIQANRLDQNHATGVSVDDIWITSCSAFGEKLNVLILISS